MAVDALTGQAREAFALKLVEGVVHDHLEKLGAQATRKAIETVAREMLDNDSKWPVAKLSVEDTWLIGQRSVN